LIPSKNRSTYHQQYKFKIFLKTYIQNLEAKKEGKNKKNEANNVEGRIICKCDSFGVDDSRM
jgi:hypothetical protein